MTLLDFNARAELFLGRDRQTAAAQGPRLFPTAAQAIRFALEEAAPVHLHGASLKVGPKTYSAGELPWLYRSPDYPFMRKRLQTNAGIGVHDEPGKAAPRPSAQAILEIVKTKS